MLDLGTVGQINTNTKLGSRIYDLVFSNNFDNIVDIGTWNGLGTTSCILQALLDSNNTTTDVITIELYPDIFKVAKNNLSKYENERFKMLNGRIVEPDSINSIDMAEIKDEQNVVHYSTWYEKDVELLSKAIDVSNELPNHIDLLILDGGEYTTYSEWQKLKNTVNYFVLDDTKTIKCKKIRQEIIDDKQYEIIYDVQDDRNGYIIGKRLCC